MKKIALDALSRELLGDARASTSGRAARTLYGGHDQRLRQTVVALTGGSSLAEHRSPGEASLQVLSGSVVLTRGTASWQLQRGDYLPLPPDDHAVHAGEDSVLLFTTSMPRGTDA